MPADSDQMPTDPESGFGRFLHRDTKARQPGEAFGAPITMASEAST